MKTIFFNADMFRCFEDAFYQSVVCHCISTGQVLQHINLGDYVERTVPSLKDLQKEISGGSDLGALSLLRFTMQILQRSVLCHRNQLSFVIFYSLYLRK